MPVYKNETTGAWDVQCYYRNYDGSLKHKVKRGFDTKTEALEWEANFIASASDNLDMTFASFLDKYAEDVTPKIRLNTWMTKKHIIETKILPTFGHKKMCDITSRDVIRWQNALIEDEDADYSQTYLKTINNQLTAIFNHAVRYYGLLRSPCAAVKSMGKKDPETEMQFWTKDEYLSFANEAMSKPYTYHAFEMLYWCGIRCGELLALTPADFNFKTGILSIDKSYQRISGQDIITEPKTPKSKRKIMMPKFLIEEMEEYLSTMVDLRENDRIFSFTKHALNHEMKRCSAIAGVKKIRIHDLRHSHVSMLIDMGFTPLAIAYRLGHESIEITYRYAHLFPNTQADIANALNNQKGVF